MFVLIFFQPTSSSFSSTYFFYCLFFLLSRLKIFFLYQILFSAMLLLCKIIQRKHQGREKLESFHEFFITKLHLIKAAGISMKMTDCRCSVSTMEKLSMKKLSGSCSIIAELFNKLSQNIFLVTFKFIVSRHRFNSFRFRLKKGYQINNTRKNNIGKVLFCC